MAQTTPDASFGPVLVISVLPNAYFVDYSCRYYKTLVSIYKKRKKFKKKLTYGPNDARCVIWARSRHLRPPYCVLHRLQL
jgi:hypothetical protein